MSEPYRFAWCETQQHSMCRGSYRRVSVADKHNLIQTGETRECGCICHER